MRLSLGFSLCLILLLPPLAAGQTRSELERTLNAEYQGKVLTQRHFLTGTRLQYTADGVSAASETGPWTTDGQLRVLRVSLPNDHTLEIQGERLFLVYDSATKGFLDAFSPAAPKADLNDKQLERLQARRKVVVDITSEDRLDEAKARASLGQVFLRPEEHLSDFVPEFWREFLRKREGGSESPAPAPDPHSEVFTVGGGVSAPRVIANADPMYAEVARMAKYQGTVVLWLVITAEGEPSALRVVRPAGLGLEEKAVNAVQQWKFRPAMRNGEPVPVRINVEVNFRLY